MPAWTLAYLYRITKGAGVEKEGIDELSDLYQSVRTCLPQEKEESIKITGLKVYPFRGMVPAEDQIHDYIDVGKYGIRYDRELALLDLETGMPL